MLNHIVLQGRLTRDPDLRTTGSGISVCSFTVAWSEKYKENETKLFMPCVAWRATGEMIPKYFSKGKEIAVEGKLTTREWTDKEGNNRQTVELTVDRVHFCGKKQTDGGGDSYSPPVQDYSELEGDDGELPF